MLDFMYQIHGRERDAFAEYWCGPDQFVPWKETLCAVYTPEKDSDGQKVEVYCEAGPARFYTLKVFPRPNSIGEVQAGYEIHTGSGMHLLAAALARQIAQGMIGFEPSSEIQP